MKAKEWAALFVADEGFSKTLEAYVKEGMDLYEKRGRTLNALECTLREQFQKFSAIRRLVPSLENYHFEDAMEQHARKEWDIFCQYMTIAAEKTAVRRNHQQYVANAKKIDTEPNLDVRLGMRLANFLDYMDTKREIAQVYKR